MYRYGPSVFFLRLFLYNFTSEPRLTGLSFTSKVKLCGKSSIRMAIIALQPKIEIFPEKETPELIVNPMMSTSAAEYENEIPSGKPVELRAFFMDLKLPVGLIQVRMSLNIILLTLTAR